MNAPSHASAVGKISYVPIIVLGLIAFLVEVMLFDVHRMGPLVLTASQNERLWAVDAIVTAKMTLGVIMYNPRRSPWQFGTGYFAVGVLMALIAEFGLMAKMP